MSEKATSVSEEKKSKKRKSMPNTYVILFFIIVFIAVLTWFVPGGAYKLDKSGHAISGTYHLTASSPYQFLCSSCSSVLFWRWWSKAVP